MVRGIQLCLILGSLAACSSGPGRPSAPVAFATGEGALQQVCTAPSSHRQIIKAVRALDWPLASRQAIPKQVIGNGMVVWSDVAVSPRQDLVVAAGRLGGTSFCRVYVRQPSSTVQLSLAHIEVLGAPLGTPDFRQRVDGSDVVGWHKRLGPEWRAVHVSVAAPTGFERREMPLMIEVTRSAT
jgi:hypothetical protein